MLHGAHNCIKIYGHIGYIYGCTCILHYCGIMHALFCVLELLGIQQGLKGGSFMPFVSEDRSRDYKQLAAQSVFPKCPVLEALQGCSEESLVGLLCDFSFDGKHPDEWMKALEHFLWGSDVLPEVGPCNKASLGYLLTSLM